MARLFISHSSSDKPFVRLLCKDLQERGHACWLDEWEIKVGESIPAKLEAGLDGCDQLLLVLSKKAVESKWVEREWRSKFWQQINSGKTLVLPCLIEQCDIPSMLGDIKYANFVGSYSRGLGELIDSISPIKSNSNPQEGHRTAQSIAIAALIASTQKKDQSLSALLGEALTMAHSFGFTDLEQFCKGELVEPAEGDADPEDAGKKRPWRVVSCFAATDHVINPDFIGFNHSSNALFRFIENDSSFVPVKMVWDRPVSQIEASVDEPVPPNAMCITLDHSLPAKGGGKKKVILYLRLNAMKLLLTSIRDELSRRLIALLPPPSAK